MEGEPKPVYSREKFEDLQKRYYNSPHFYSGEATARAEYLREKYPDYESCAFYHILIGSTINEDIVKITYEDFPGKDSVELFIDNLINQK